MLCGNSDIQNSGIIQPRQELRIGDIILPACRCLRMKSQPISHHRIRHKPGEGGMGVIGKAKDTTLRRTEARKLLLQRQALRGLAGLRNHDLRQLRG